MPTARCWARVAPLVLFALPLAPANAVATTILINNGLAPPVASNVIDDATFAMEDVFVRNVGCDSTEPNQVSPCPAPGDSTTVGVESGAEIGSLSVFDASRAVVDGGSLGLLEARDAAHIALRDGSVVGSDLGAPVLRALFGGRIVMSGGFATAAEAQDGGELVVEGGQIAGELGSFSGARVTWRGGSVDQELVTRFEGELRVAGSDFAIDGVPTGLGEVAEASGFLSGTLASGETFDVFFRRTGIRGGTPGTLRLVPEPGSALLVGSGLALLAGRRRRGSTSGCG